MMGIEIRTLIVVTGITHLLQVLVFLHQYKVNKNILGPGWWLLWSATESLGFALILLRQTPALLPIAILLQNGIILLGTIFIYIGVRRFFNQPVNYARCALFFTVYMALHLFFFVVRDDIQIRTMLLDASLSAIGFLTAWQLYTNKIRSITSTANFNSALFALHGSIFAFRTVWIALGIPYQDLFSTTAFNLIQYFDALFIALMWTFGFSIMLNQRLNAEREELISELQGALEQIKTLRGIVPICASCKKIRDDKGYWEQVDAYVARHTEAQFSHAICPDCAAILYPGYGKTNKPSQ